MTTTRAHRRIGLAALVLAAASWSVAACGGDGSGNTAGANPVDVQLARAALVERADLAKGFDEAKRGTTTDPFSKVADDCDDVAAIDDATTTARETGGAFLSGDRSRWVTSSVWTFPDAEAAAAAVTTLTANDAGACFIPYFRLRFIEITVDVTPAPDLVMSDSTATPIDNGDGGMRVVTRGRYEIGSSAAPIVFELTIVRSGRALAMLQTIDGSTEPAESNSELLELMLQSLGKES